MAYLAQEDLKATTGSEDREWEGALTRENFSRHLKAKCVSQ